MNNEQNELVNLENRFWQAIVEEDADTAISMLDEPAIMVSEHGPMQFNHAAYREMAQQAKMVVKSYELSDMRVVFPNEDTAILTYKVKQALQLRGQSRQTVEEMADSSVWAKKDDGWKCVMHTETSLI